MPLAILTGLPRPTPRLDLASLGQLTFEEPDLDRFPCLALAQRALRTLGGSPTILNAANEVAVEAFLAGRIGFSAIAGIVETALDACESPERAPEIDR